MNTEYNVALFESYLYNQAEGNLSKKGCELSENVQECDYDAKYRTLDGTCNNLFNTKQGAAATPMPRLMDNAYLDGKFPNNSTKCCIFSKEYPCREVAGIPLFFQVLEE